MVDRIVSNLSIGSLDLKMIDNGDGSFSLATASGAGAAAGAALGMTVVQSPIREVVSQYQRPNNTTAYATGEVVNETVATVKAIPGCSLVAGGGALIESIYLEVNSNQATKLSLPEIWLFSNPPAADADNAAFTPEFAELNSRVAIIPLDAVFVGKADAGAAGTCVYTTSSPVHFGFKCAVGNTNLYWVLVVRNAYTPIANEIFRLKLNIQD